MKKTLSISLPVPGGAWEMSARRAIAGRYALNFYARLYLAGQAKPVVTLCSYADFDVAGRDVHMGLGGDFVLPSRTLAAALGRWRLEVHETFNPIGLPRPEHEIDAALAAQGEAK